MRVKQYWYEAQTSADNRNPFGKYLSGVIKSTSIVKGLQLLVNGEYERSFPNAPLYCAIAYFKKPDKGSDPDARYISSTAVCRQAQNRIGQAFERETTIPFASKGLIHDVLPKGKKRYRARIERRRGNSWIPVLEFNGGKWVSLERRVKS